MNDLAFGKLDYQLNSANHLSANFDWDNFHAPNSYNSAATSNNNSLTVNGPTVTHTRFLIATWNSVIYSDDPQQPPFPVGGGQRNRRHERSGSQREYCECDAVWRESRAAPARLSG